MTALHLVTSWPVEHAAAAVVTPEGAQSVGDPDRIYRLASLTKPMVAWAVMIAVEEGVVDLDVPLAHVRAPQGATMRHLLAHAAGFAFDGPDPIAPIERRRIYSNTGIEVAAQELAATALMPFADYLREAVFQPLGMCKTALVGSPAYGAQADLSDVVRFLHELLRPTLVSTETALDVITPQYPALAGIVPNVGRFDPCPWGLGVEVRGTKAPHWTGRANSPATFGHFGGSGSMMWVDPTIDTALVALTDRPFDEWREDALTCWPALSDAVIDERKRDL